MKVDNQRFRELLYDLSQAEWNNLLNESVGIWLRTVNEDELPELKQLCKGFDKKVIKKLSNRGFLTGDGCFTKMGTKFVKKLYSYQGKRLPLPITKDQDPRLQLSSDKQETFERIAQALRLVVSHDEMKPILRCIYITEDGITATNGHILANVKYKTNQEPFLYDIVEGEESMKGAEYPKWKQIIWDTKKAVKHYNGLVLDMYTKLKAMAKLFPDSFGRSILIGELRFSIVYFNIIFKVLYDFGIVDCNMYINQDKDGGMIIKAHTRGYKFLLMIMPIRWKPNEPTEYDLAIHYSFEDIVEAQESEGFMGMI